MLGHLVPVSHGELHYMHKNQTKVKVMQHFKYLIIIGYFYLLLGKQVLFCH